MNGDGAALFESFVSRREASVPTEEPLPPPTVYLLLTPNSRIMNRIKSVVENAIINFATKTATVAAFPPPSQQAPGQDPPTTNNNGGIFLRITCQQGTRMVYDDNHCVA